MAQQAADGPLVHAWSTKSDVPFFRLGNYAPVFDELTTFDLPVEGAIPRELNGWDLPLVFRLDIARNSSRDLPYRWSDDYGARLGVSRRDDPYGPIRWFEIDRVTFFMSSTPSIRPQMMANLSCCKQLVIPSCGATLACLDSTP